MKIVTLSNGLRVANFSSPHEFKFTDGNVVPAQSAEVAEHLELEAMEEVVDRWYSAGGHHIDDVSIDWIMTSEVRDAIQKWIKSWQKNQVDVVLVPLPVMAAMKNDGWGEDTILAHPFRVVRPADRITKEVHIDKFCV